MLKLMVLDFQNETHFEFHPKTGWSEKQVKYWRSMTCQEIDNLFLKTASQKSGKISRTPPSKSLVFFLSGIISINPVIPRKDQIIFWFFI